MPRVLLVRDRTVAVHPDGTLRLVDRDEPGPLVLAGGVTAALAGPGDDPGPFAEVRELAAAIAPDEFALAATALALTAWHEEHPRCSRCGAATELARGGRRRRCPACGARHRPRTDPSVIALVTRGDEALLVRRPDAIPGRYTCVSGFVDPGESAEQAVVREVAEETGLAVGVESVRFVASQPWPGPHSLMLGFTAEAAPGDDVVLAPDELTDFRWTTPDALRRAYASGELVEPPPLSMAHRLVIGWMARAASSATAR